MKLYFSNINDVVTVNGCNNIIDVLCLLSDKQYDLPDIFIKKDVDSFLVVISKSSPTYFIESNFYIPDNLTLDGITFNNDLNLYDFILKVNKLLKLFKQSEQTLKGIKNEKE